MSAAAVVFDTSIYIGYLRRDAHAELVEQTGRAGRVRMSAVVVAELYAGTRSKADKADLDRVTRAYLALGFLVAPDARDWMLAGQAIRRHRDVHGAVEDRLHWNDLLILLCGAKAGAEIVTENARHFLRWASLLAKMGVRCRVRVARHDG